ncbi:hypothetical protein K449DRAFT_381347 [Hypoxylon sp. EC38]|nr:hypothetical protein K449DRAFT_381347 [Hypoxylon sp. EC38]
MSIPDTRCHPVYSGPALPWQQRLQLGRRYGKYDFGRFERLEGSVHYIGQGKIGDIEVACKFLFRESRWGVLTPDKNPGGVVYLDLTFTEPPGCRLRCATVLLTLDEEDEDLRRHFSAESSSAKAKVPVHITEHGPQSLHGQIDEALKITKHHFSPRIEVGGFAGAGGVGRDSEKHYVQRSQWKFSSLTMPNKLLRPTILKWNLVESELDRQPRHDNTFHTGFAFEHDGQPFLMQVEVSGCLEGIGSHLCHKAKQKFKKFKFPIEPQTATTLVNFQGRDNPYRTPLDELAKKIPYDMIEKNMKLVAQVPMKPSNTGDYYELIEDGDSSRTERDNPHDQQQHCPPQDIDIPQLTPMEELREQALAVMSLGGPSIGRTISTRVPDLLPPTDYQQPETPNCSPSAPESQTGQTTASTTLVDEEHDEVTREVALAMPQVNHEEVQKLLRDYPLPAVFHLIILWVLAVGVRIAPLLSRSKNTTSLRKSSA